MARSLTARQRALQWIYPLLMKGGDKKSRTLSNEQSIMPPTSFYSLHVLLNNNNRLSFEGLRGKKVLLVNTASDCGYTAQYAELQKLHEQYKSTLVIIGFPANDFKEQEKKTDEEINQFCTVNFGVTFFLSKKSTILKGSAQHEVYQWLSNKDKNGWCRQAPKWNFSKYLVSEQGVLTHYFDPAVSPLSDVVITAIKR
jgi:glutathione peroxidase